MSPIIKSGGNTGNYLPNLVQPDVYFDNNQMKGGKAKKGGDLGGSLVALLLVTLEEAWRNKIKQSGGEYTGSIISDKGLNLYQNSGVSLPGPGGVNPLTDPSGAVTNASGPDMRKTGGANKKQKAKSNKK